MFSKPTARALAILDLLMANPHESIGLTEMTRRLNLNKATCHAILSTMAKYGFLTQDSKNKSYRLGPSIVAAGNAAFAQFPVLEFARPELEKIVAELSVGCAAIGRTQSHIVLLSLLGSTDPFASPLHHGLRLPNAAPIGAAFIAWSPAPQLEQWIQKAHDSLGGYNEKLDQRLRVGVIGVRARGYEVALKTKAEQDLMENLKHIHKTWNLDALDEYTQIYQKQLCEETYYLDRIDAKTRYPVSIISVPVFGFSQEPELVFSVGSFTSDLTGKEIIDIAERLQEAANQATNAARNSSPLRNPQFYS